MFHPIKNQKLLARRSQSKIKNCIVWLLAICRLSFAQQQVDMDEAVAIALANHPVARNIALAEQKDILMQQQTVDLAPLQIKYWQRHAQTGNDRLWSVTQDFGAIPEHFRRAQHYRTQTSARQTERALTLDHLAWQVKAAYMDVVYCRQRLRMMQEHNPYFETLISIAETRLTADSIPKLMMVSTGARYAAYQSRMYIAEEELKRAEIRLCQLMYLPDGNIEPDDFELELYRIHPEKYADDRFDPVKHKAMDEAQLTEAKSLVKLEKSKLYPAIHAGYIYQNIEGMNDYHGWMAGLSVPLWMQPQRARIKQAEIDVKIKAGETEYRQFADMQHVETLKSLLNEYFVQISFYRENLLIEARLVIEEVEKDFAADRISNIAEMITKVSNAVVAKLNCLGYICLYNQTALELEYYTQ